MMAALGENNRSHTLESPYRASGKGLAGAALRVWHLLQSKWA